MSESNIEYLINSLIPFKDLDSGDRLRLAQTGEIIKKELGDKIHAAEVSDYMLYLVSGKLDYCEQYLQPYLIKEKTIDALKPLFSEDANKETFVEIFSSCELWQFDRKLFNRLIEKEVIIDERELSHHIDHVESNIYNEILQAVEGGRLSLPTLPEIALRIKKAVEKSDVDTGSISKIIELDPAISARLIKVANSPLTRGIHPIHNMRDVIVRLGLNATRNMVLSFSVTQLFSSKQAFLKKQMKVFYAHSIEIASICYALGSHIEGMDADELLLAGLIHDIGVIPIISYIEKTGLEANNEEEIMSVIQSLRVAVGVLVVKSWGLPKEMLKVVTHAEDWLHESGGKLAVQDVIIIAQIYDMLRRKKIANMPNINNVPAFKKLFPDKHDPAFAMKILDEAHEEINEMKGLLGI